MSLLDILDLLLLSQVVLDIVAVCIALQVVVLTKVRNVVALSGVI